jgi:hypothetical protein
VSGVRAAGAAGSAGHAMTITLPEVRDTFFEMEVSERLFERRLGDGTAYWDIVRVAVWSALHAVHGGSRADPLAPVPPSLLSRAKDLGRGQINRLTIGYMTTRQPDYLFITTQRNVHGGGQFDSIADHLLQLVADRAVAAETTNRGSISHWRTFLRRPTRIAAPQLRPAPPAGDLSAAAAVVAGAIQRHFGSAIDLPGVMRGPIAVFEQTRQYYRALFSAYRPRAVLLANNGRFKGLFAAAEEAGVPTVELQHGASCSNNIFWSYPPSVDRATRDAYLPTAYLTFADYWQHNTHYPVRTTRTIGNDLFAAEAGPGSEDDIAIISAHMFHAELAEVAVGLARAFPARTIHYKLHPHQYPDRQRIAASFSRFANIRVVGDEIDADRLFDRCAYVVGVHSTLLYTAVHVGKKVCILERYHYFWNADIFPYTEQFSNVDRLVQILREPVRHFAGLPNRPVMFERFDPERFRQVLAEIERPEETP